jgi:hypothetical protein
MLNPWAWLKASAKAAVQAGMAEALEEFGAEVPAALADRLRALPAAPALPSLPAGEAEAANGQGRRAGVGRGR